MSNVCFEKGLGGRLMWGVFVGRLEFYLRAEEGGGNGPTVGGSGVENFYSVPASPY